MAPAHGLADAQKRLRPLIARLASSTIVRGTHPGESHGGLYLIDLEAQSVEQALDWSTPDIDLHGAEGGRGLRGIAIDGETVFVASGDELRAYTPDFKPVSAWRNPYLRHCHAIAVWERTLYLVSAACDSVLGFDLDAREFHWAMHVQSANYRFSGSRFDPMSSDGPLPIDKLKLTNVFCNRHGMYISGLQTGGMLHFNGKHIRMAVQLPAGAHDARPFRDGVVFNDTEADALRYTGRGEGTEDRAMVVPDYPDSELTRMDAIAEGIARPGFARGLSVLSDTIVAGGSSPATVTIYDLAANATLGSVKLTADVRSTIHSIAEWPFD